MTAITNIQPATVLLIDDEESLLFGLSAVMKRAGYEVVTARNGADGLSLAQEAQPDIIVCDVMMPAPDGFELRQRLSQDPQTINIPFIFLTARTDLDDKLMGIKSGADDYITKPFDRQELVARVESVLRRSEIGKDLGRTETWEKAEEKFELLRREILQNIHHELRTPLAKVLGALELGMLANYENPEDKNNFLDLALTNSRHLHFLVEDLIFLTNLDQGSLNTLRQTIDLNVDFSKAIDKQLSIYQEKNLDVKVTISNQGEIYAPRLEFKKAAIHLVDNALKFSPDYGKVKIQLTSQGDGGCVLSIEDEGPGIPTG